MIENPNFEQNYWSIRSENIYKIAHDSITLTKWLIFHDRFFYDNINYFALMGSVCKHLNEISKRWILRRSKRSSIENSSNWK